MVMSLSLVPWEACPLKLIIFRFCMVLSPPVGICACWNLPACAQFCPLALGSACCCWVLPAVAGFCLLLLRSACCCLLLPAAACCCLLLPAAACCCLLLLGSGFCTLVLGFARLWRVLPACAWLWFVVLSAAPTKTSKCRYFYFRHLMKILVLIWTYHKSVFSLCLLIFAYFCLCLLIFAYFHLFF